MAQYLDRYKQNNKRRRRNFIANGSCQLNQRKIFTSLTADASSGRQYRFDRLFARTNPGSSGVMELSNGDAIGPCKYSHYVAPTTTDTSLSGTEHYKPCSYKFEGYDAICFVGNPLTLSFYFNSNVTGTFGVQFEGGDSVGNKQWVWMDKFSFTSGQGVTRYVFHIPPPQIDYIYSHTNGWGGQINLCGVSGATYNLYTDAQLGTWVSDTNWSTYGWQTPVTNWMASTSNWLHIGGVQLELGDQVSDFIKTPVAIDQAVCERYYRQFDYVGGSGYASAASQAGVAAAHIGFVPEMRATPSIATTPLNGADSLRTSNTNVANSSVTKHGAAFTVTSNAAGNVVWNTGSNAIEVEVEV